MNYWNFREQLEKQKALNTKEAPIKATSEYCQKFLDQQALYRDYKRKREGKPMERACDRV